MKKYSGVVIILAVVFVMGLAGVPMIRKTSATENENDTGTLIGMLITTESLNWENSDTYANEHIKEIINGENVLLEDTSTNELRMYATFNEIASEDGSSEDEYLNTDFYFEGVDGFGFYAIKDPDSESSYIMCGDDGIETGIHYNITDNSKETTLSGTIYVNPETDDDVYYVNPVFQLDDGRIYATFGSGYSIGAETGEGNEFRANISSTITVKENGESQERTFEVEAALSVLLPPSKIRIVQMNEQDEVLTATEYLPEEIPESFQPDKATSYLLLEETKEDSNGETYVQRSIFSRGEETLTTYSVADHGLILNYHITLDW